MTPEILSKEIARLSEDLDSARAAFDRLNCGRQQYVFDGRRVRFENYRQFSADTERMITLHAEQIARLQNFLSHMRTKEMISGL